jgi:hypothetical protein
MAPSKSKFHFETNQREHKVKIFNTYVKAYMSAKFKSENVFMSSMKISYRISREGEGHTIGEILVKPCVTDLAAGMTHEEVARKIHKI